MEEKQLINDEYIISLFFIDKLNPHRIRPTSKRIINENKEIREYIENRFHDFTGDYKETLHRIKYKIEKIPKCIICGKPLKYYGLSNMLYGKICLRKCQYEYMKTDDFKSKVKLIIHI